MKNTVKAGLYAAAGTALIAANSVQAINFSQSNEVDAGLVGSNNTADNVLETWLAYLVGFLYLIAVAMIIWGAWNILTAAGDDDKVSNGKKILLQAVAGLIVVFLANSIISWVITGLFANAGA